MKAADLTGRRPDWLTGTGPENDVIVSSRVRLARNVAGMPFLTRCSPQQLRELAASLRKTLVEAKLPGVQYIDVERAGEADRQLLVERHLISRQQAEAKGPRGVAVAAGETLAVMVNEEDHVRLQADVVQLDACYQHARRVDDLLEGRLDFAFSSRFGYLTACPTNVGTGLRVSVMAHLPGLKITGEIEKVLRAARDMHLAVRGLYGEGTEAIGDMFQISNQSTLGKSEEQIITEFRDTAVPGIIDYERHSRRQLLKTRRLAVEDKVHRARAILGAARLISSEETMYLLSHLLLGLSLGLVEKLDLASLYELMLVTQPAHLQRMLGGEMTPVERGEARARLIRQRLGMD